MRKVASVCALVLVSFVATEVSARDLLSARNPAKPVVRAVAMTGTATYPEPFTTTRGKSSYVCSISGLGETARCVVRTWPERRGMSLRTATN